MELKDFRPVSAAVLPRTSIQKPAFPVIDFHTHMGKMLLGDNYAEKYDTAEYARELAGCGVALAVDMDGYGGEDLRALKAKTAGFEKRFIHFMQLDYSEYDGPDFREDIRRQIREAYEEGCRGIKMWKDLALYKKDKNGEPLRMDDPRFDAVYDTAAEIGIPILMHIADPKAFFMHVDETNERWEELHEMPEWDFSDHSKYMSFEELMEMQENVIRDHPQTVFIVAHVGSCAEDLAWVGDQLDRYPNMNVDIAARLAELGRVPYSAKRFFEKYQDRIVFGTDSTPESMGYHRIYYRFLETEDEYFPYHLENETPGQGRWEIYGIGLDHEILKKVYYKNACRILGIDPERFEEEANETISEC